MTHTIGETLERFALAETVLTGIFRTSELAGVDPGDVFSQLSRWRFVTNSRVIGRWGQCRYNERTIEVHALLLDHPADLKVTLIHECAHAIDMLVHGTSSRHGSRWRMVMRHLGAAPNTTHSNEAVAAFVALRARRARQHWRCVRCDYTVAILKRRKYPASSYTHTNGCGGKFTVV